jgi:uncharacterized protein (TIGR00730 family)
MSRAICVYCSASTAIDAAYTELATRLGEQIAARGETLVFGGTNIGLMSTLATAVKSGGGRVIGVIPIQIQGTPYAFDQADELIHCAARGLRHAGRGDRSHHAQAGAIP